MKLHPAATGRRAQAKQDKRNRMLAAATDLLAERDLGRVSMQEIADLLMWPSARCTSTPVPGGAAGHGAEPEIRHRDRRRP